MTSTYPARISTIIALVATALFVLMQLYASVPLLHTVSHDLGAPATFALSTAFSLCYACGFLLWGPLADHYGRRRVLLIGMTLLVATTIGCTLAGSIPTLTLARALQGVTAASFAPIALAYLSEATAPRLRAAAIGAMSTAFLVAGITGQVSAQLIAQHYGWHSVFSASAVALAACLCAIAALMRETPGAHHNGTLAQQFTTIISLLRTRNIMFLCCAHITLLLAFVAMYTALGPHLVHLGRSGSDALLIRLIGLPGMFAALLVGPLSRRFSMRALAQAGFTLSALGLTFLAFAQGSTPGIAAASLVFVTGVAITVPTMITLFGQAAAPNRATGMALNGLVLFLGASIGSLLDALSLSFVALLLVLLTLHATAALCLRCVHTNTSDS